ncbi:winged helix DNA-binding domain-containing protein [Microbacterium sp. CIAB417]|uniref:winged helix DNA-binding domain-containing protein n=1 Tax=Microbacterium sp. CIAB417 TaxID=2860287 RepID=UPI001FADCB62|nr:winged helix DNA-binding domain-containing protein [Microbacterium sp. CIAB417]
MTPAKLRAERLRSHRLTAPAPTVADAASHLLAVQSQEFWGGRWALATRTAGAPTMRAVDALFDDGTLIRAWTQRGTLHIVPARDFAWMLRVTGERQQRAQAPRLRELGLDADVLARIERAARAALRGGNALTRAEFFDVLSGIGVDPTGQRGAHAIGDLAIRGIICQGPVVPRPDGVSREQYFVLVEEHITDAHVPDDPAAEMFVRYIDGHGPATAEDFAWWSGLTLTAARAAAASAAARLDEVDDGVYVARARPRRRATGEVLALASFEEYYISYADRSHAGTPEAFAAVGPGKNGMVRPILLADGLIVGTWRQSTALGRHMEHPTAELLADVRDEGVAAALARYAAFVTG